MVNLNNIFNKFYPRASKSPTGQRLIYMAWAIEITVALVGVFIAASLVMLGKSEIDNLDGTSSSSFIEYYIIGLSFFVVAIMELTKIPLATALYYAAKSYWKIIFFIALLAVNFSTFESILRGFQLAYDQQTKVIKIKSNELDVLQEKILNITSTKDLELNIDKDIKKIHEKISNLRKEISIIQINTNKQIEKLVNQNAIENPRNNSLLKEIEDLKLELKSLMITKEKLELSLLELKKDFSGKKRKVLVKQIEQYKTDINIKNNELKQKRLDFDKINKNITSQNKLIIDELKKQEKLQITTIQKQINSIVKNQLKLKENEKSRLTEFGTSNNKMMEKLENQILEKRKEIVDIASNNQIYRLALLVKTGPAVWFFGDEISGEITEADLTQEDIDRAFWLWFGFLAFVISIIGTLVAFAGLNLMDERIDETNNKHLDRRNTLLYRFSKIIVLLNKYFLASIKSKLKPKIVEKIVEKKVKVEVEKPVYEEKIVYKTVEVPKEVTKKEIVHVPLWTQDPELLKK